MNQWILPRPKNIPPACFLNGLSNPSAHPNKKAHPLGGLSYLVGVSGFEPEASWTRTKRDTKLRHTPIANILYLENGYLSSVCREIPIQHEYMICAYYNHRRC